MDAKDIQDIVKRLEALEAENRSLRAQAETRRSLRRRTLTLWIVASSVFVGLPLGLAAQRAGTPRSIEAESFVLRDRSGKVKALWETTAEGMPRISLHDDQGLGRIEFLFRPDGTPAMHFRDADGRERLLLGIEANGVAALGIMGGKGKERISLGTDAQGRLAMCFYDGSFKRVISLDANAAGMVRTRGIGPGEDDQRVLPASSQAPQYGDARPAFSRGMGETGAVPPAAGAASPNPVGPGGGGLIPPTNLPPEISPTGPGGGGLIMPSGNPPPVESGPAAPPQVNPDGAPRNPPRD